MKPAAQSLTNRVKAFRIAKGLSQQQLAELVGVKRQAIYDIESGKYAPNTLLALRLAKQLACRVEDLFSEDDETSAPSYTLIGAPPNDTARVSLAIIRGRLLAYPLPGANPFGCGFEAADGILAQDQDKIHLLCPPEIPEKSIILLGCDPAFALLSTHVARLAPEMRVHYRFASSVRAMQGLAAGQAHIAGTHMQAVHSKEDGNILLASKNLPGQEALVIAFSDIEEGLLVAPGNPLRIGKLEDLANPAVRLVNREPGAALRSLLDDLLQRHGIPAEVVKGYEDMVESHAEGAMRVLYKQADAALGFRAVADLYGLDFIPLVSARCDLVVPRDLMGHPAVNILLDTLQTRKLREEIKSLAGYDAGRTGGVIARI